MKSPRFLLLLTCVLFTVFLFGQTAWRQSESEIPPYLPGYEQVVILFGKLCWEVFHPSGWILMVVPILLADTAFLALPILFFLKLLDRPRLNQALRLTFLCGSCAYSYWLWHRRYVPTKFGAYFWLMAAMTAVECLARCNPQPASVERTLRIGFGIK